MSGYQPPGGGYPPPGGGPPGGYGPPGGPPGGYGPPGGGPPGGPPGGYPPPGGGPPGGPPGGYPPPGGGPPGGPPGGYGPSRRRTSGRLRRTSRRRTFRRLRRTSRRRASRRLPWRASSRRSPSRQRRWRRLLAVPPGHLRGGHGPHRHRGGRCADGVRDRSSDHRPVLRRRKRGSSGPNAKAEFKKLGISYEKADPNKIIAKLEKRAKKWRKDAKFYSMHINELQSDGTLDFSSKKPTMTVEFFSPSLVGSSAARSTRRGSASSSSTT